MSRLMGTTVMFAFVLTALALTETQSKPDFSGTWVPQDSGRVNAPPPPPPPPPPAGYPTPPPPPPPPETLALTITQTASTFIIERHVSVDGRPDTFTTVYQLDGTPTSNPNGAVLLQSTAAWDGEAIVFSNVASLPDGTLAGTIRDVYRLERGRLITDSTLVARGHTASSRAVYRKK
jgi:hypothetical protein